DATVTVTVRNYARRERAVAVEASVDDRPWARTELVLAARAAEPVRFAEPPAAGRLVVRLLADDALAVDNQAVGWIPPDEPIDLLLVTESTDLAMAFDQLAATIPGSSVLVETPARYRDHPVTAVRAALFDRFVPDPVPALNALYVAPPPANALCPRGPTIDGAAVIDWESEHGAAGSGGAGGRPAGPPDDAAVGRGGRARRVAHGGVSAAGGGRARRPPDRLPGRGARRRAQLLRRRSAAGAHAEHAALARRRRRR